MKSFRKALCFLIVTTLVFVVANSIYEKYYWEDDLDKLEALDMYRKMKENSASGNILYFGESSNGAYASYDSVRLSISDILNTLVAPRKLISIDRGAIHAGVYTQLISMIPEHSAIDTIVVTMNLRSFNSDWKNSTLENNCQELIVAYSTYPVLLSKLRLLMKAYDYKEDWKRREIFLSEMKNTSIEGPVTYKTIREWDDHMANTCCRDSNGVPDMPKVELSCHFVKAYGFTIDLRTDPRIKDFDEMITICRKKKIKILFNLLAENVECADRLVGEELLYLMHRNRCVLIDRYTTDCSIVIDNFDLVGERHFTDKTFPTEHYDYTGRMIIAKNIARYF